MTFGSTNLDVNWHLHVNCFASAPDVLYYLYRYPRIVRTQKVEEVAWQKKFHVYKVGTTGTGMYSE